MLPPLVPARKPKECTEAAIPILGTHFLLKRQVGLAEWFPEGVLGSPHGPPQDWEERK